MSAGRFDPFNPKVDPDTALRLFGKPRVEGQRRVAVTLARAQSVDEARERARVAAAALDVRLA